MRLRRRTLVLLGTLGVLVVACLALLLTRDDTPPTATPAPPSTPTSAPGSTERPREQATASAAPTTAPANGNSPATTGSSPVSVPLDPDARPAPVAPHTVPLVAPTGVAAPARPAAPAPDSPVVLLSGRERGEELDGYRSRPVAVVVTELRQRFPHALLLAGTDQTSPGPSNQVASVVLLPQAPGTGQQVQVNVHSPADVSTPPVTGMKLQEALKTLIAAGASVHRITTAPGCATASAPVVCQVQKLTQPDGTFAGLGLQVSSDPSYRASVDVPDLVNLDADLARRVTLASGLGPVAVQVKQMSMAAGEAKANVVTTVRDAGKPRVPGSVVYVDVHPVPRA